MGCDSWNMFGDMGSAVQKTLLRQTTEILNVSWNPDLEHNTPIFSLETLWLMIINHQPKFGCKRIINAKDIVKIVIF